MPYPNYYPNYLNYQNQQSQQIQPTQAPIQQMQSGIIWVQGEAGAKSYLVAPNTTVQLWDSESPAIYIKSADASGMPSMKIIDYTIRDNTSKTQKFISESGFVTKDDISLIEERLDSIEDKLEGLTSTSNKKSNLRKESKDE